MMTTIKNSTDGQEIDFDLRNVVKTVVLAAIFWFVTFATPWGSFWLKISVSAMVLAAMAIILQPARYLKFTLGWRNVLFGLVSALVLYLIFWLGKAVSTAILPFAGSQIDAVYGQGGDFPKGVVVLLLLFVTGPCEEIYWRGYLQRQLMSRFGGTKGWLLATAIYAGVHISSGNFMLIAAALVAGAFWGAMYRKCNDLTPVIISHSLWSAVIFAVMPV